MCVDHTRQLLARAAHLRSTPLVAVLPSSLSQADNSDQSYTRGRITSGPERPVSESKLQSELNQAGQIDGVGDNAEVSATECPVRRTKLGMVKEVEKL